MTKIQILGRKRAVTFILFHTDEGKFIGEVRVHGNTLDVSIPPDVALVVRASERLP